MTLLRTTWTTAALLAVAVNVAAAERALDKTIVVPAGVDAVWQAWTTTEGITSFFAPGAEIEPRVGGAFHVYMDPGAEPGEKGADDMRILAIQPKRMLSFDWNAPPSLPQARQQRTLVIVRLQPVDGTSTRVTLHHTGWGDGGEWDQAYTYFDRAWDQVLGSLKTRFESGPKDWKPWLAQLEAWRAQRAGPGKAVKE
jgi:uncharacterized protein YndB with AHSA1/START domain